MSDFRGYRKLASEVVLAAVRDLQGHGLGIRLTAAAWLASKGATLWCDIAGVDQMCILERCGWYEVAERALLEAKDATDSHLHRERITDAHISVLKTAVTHFDLVA